MEDLCTQLYPQMPIDDFAMMGQVGGDETNQVVDRDLGTSLGQHESQGIVGGSDGVETNEHNSASCPRYDTEGQRPANAWRRGLIFEVRLNVHRESHRLHPTVLMLAIS